MNKLILIIGIIVLTSGVARTQGTNTFNPVNPTGIPYTIIISGASLNGGALFDSTEIAVFDDTLCVGTVFFVDSGNLQLVAWEGDAFQNLPGFTQGNAMSFKVRIKIGSDYYIEDALPNYSVGDGTFGYGGFSVLDLTITSTAVQIEEADIFSDISIFPNPISDYIYFDFNDNDCHRIEIYDINGNILLRNEAEIPFRRLHLPVNFIGSDTTTCFMIIRIYCSNELIIRKLLYVEKP